MKYLTTTIAAVMLVGCGPSVPDISIHEAVQDGNIEAVKQHLAAGTDVSGTDVNAMNPDGWTPLQWAAYEAYRDYAEKNVIIKLLIAQGADVNAKTEEGDTPLHFAAEGKSFIHSINKNIVEQFIDAGADVNAKDYEGKTPLDRAIASDARKNAKRDQINVGDSQLADLLRKYGGKTAVELKAASN